MNQFEEFTQKHQKKVEEARATISEWGIISLNKKTLHDFVSPGKNFCVFFFDKEASRIGMRPIKKRMTNSFKINRNKSNNYATVTARSFLKEYNLMPKTCRSYLATWSEDLKMIILDLKNPKDRTHLEEISLIESTIVDLRNELKEIEKIYPKKDFTDTRNKIKTELEAVIEIIKETHAIKTKRDQ